MPDLDWLRQFCLSFPEAAEDMPWADDLCFKVRGKIFAGTALSDGRFPRLSLKCSPESFHELIEIEGIAPAPYVGRYKWIQISRSDLLPAAELESLIRQSYELVAAKAPGNKSRNQKAPETRAARTRKKKGRARKKFVAKKKSAKRDHKK